MGAVAGILRAVSPARPGNTDIVQDVMPIVPGDLETWLEKPPGKCPRVDADFSPIPTPVDPSEITAPAQCRIGNTTTGSTVTNSSGPVLWRLFDLCQYDGMTRSPWIRSEMLMKFQVQGDCTGFRTQSLLGPGKKVILTYGNGQNGDQQNRFFSENGEVQYVYTDFPSGFSELKSGGAEVIFGGDSKPSQISIQGFEVKNFQQGETDLNERELFKETEENLQKNLELIDHVTLSTASALQVSYNGNLPTVNTGQIVTQDNEVGVILSTRIRVPLTFSDPKCCWPTSGTVITTDVITESFNEVLVFTASCGQAELQRPSRAGGISRELYTLPYCF